MKTNQFSNRLRCRSLAGGWPAAFVISFAIQALALCGVQAAEPPPPRADDGITQAIKGSLLVERGVSPSRINVTTQQGIVMLTGSVDNLLAKERAVKLAETIRGVRAVVDRITVRPMVRRDGEIQTGIVLALLRDPATESNKIRVTVNDGIVTLTGAVGSWAEMRIARRLAAGVNGARDIRNELVIDYTQPRTDRQITADISERLKWDNWVNGTLIKPDVQHGNVALTGTVGSANEKARAVADAWVNGVTMVDGSGLAVESWARDPMRRRNHPAFKMDSDIRQAVLAAFQLDPRVAPFTPDITVVGGEVILAGTVGNWQAKLAAAEDAHNTVGTAEVENYLRVQPHAPLSQAAPRALELSSFAPAQLPSDAAAEQSLTAALYSDPQLAGLPLEVAVINHEAFLRGTVDSAYQKADAFDIARQTKGVVEVRDHLTVEPKEAITNINWPNYQSDQSVPSWKSDRHIARTVDRAFRRSPFVHPSEIQVTVHHGVVLLHGTVDGWLAYGEAYRDARSSGAMAVIDKLNVKAGAWL